jgi:protein SCO1/2
MRFLLGGRRLLARVWRAFGIAPQRGELDHSAYVVLVDGRGRQRVGFPFSALTEEGLAHDLRRLGAT